MTIAVTHDKNNEARQTVRAPDCDHGLRFPNTCLSTDPPFLPADGKYTAPARCVKAGALQWTKDPPNPNQVSYIIVIINIIIIIM